MTTQFRNTRLTSFSNGANRLEGKCCTYAAWKLLDLGCNMLQQLVLDRFAVLKVPNAAPRKKIRLDMSDGNS
jgi:hypothetical protein